MPNGTIVREGVEIAKTGTYRLSSGEHTFTREQLAAAIRNAQTGPAPRIGIGHIDKRFDGAPALGKVINLRLGDDGDTLLGDFADMPGWLAEKLEQAYPGRSLEASAKGEDLHISAVKLLGLTMPGISNLKDLAQHLSDEGPLQIAAGDDSDGKYFEIVIASTEEAAQRVGDIVDPTRAAQRPNHTPEEESSMDPKQLRESIGLAADASDEDVKTRLAELNARPDTIRIGDDDVPVAEVETEITEAIAAAREDERTKITASREGEVTLDKPTYDRLLAAAETAEKLETKTIAASRDQVVEDAVRLGKIEPARREYWRGQLEDDTEHATKRLTASVEDGGLAPYSAVPVSEIGVSASVEETNDNFDGGTGLFPQLATQEA